LNLGRRGLCGAIPKAVSSFSSITVLSLFGNKMEGALPEELFSLVNLNRLNLYDNKFSGPLPAEFSNLTALETVNLSCNAFTGLIPMELALPALRELYLHQNILQGPIPMEFASRSLEEMTADMIPYSNFDKVGEWISSSQRLYWEEPVFEGAPHEGEKELLDALCEQYSEEVMQLSEGWTNWGFRSNEPLLMWRGVHLNKTGNIQSLVLRSCNMFGEIPTSVSKLERLVYLDMSLNSLEGDIPEQLATMKHLQFLHLDHNKLSGSLYILPSLKTLKTLDISHNAFDDEIPDNLKTLVGLESLRLNDNQITGNDMNMIVSRECILIVCIM
jgi:Leucine-rich repeat (LRR) protein